jgi:tRNA dimethylallyltransferase
MTHGSPPLVAIVGPTASGKTDLAIALAERVPIEVLVADSRQVYRGMDVGTATPSADVRERVVHHLIDLVDPDEPFTVADWVARARELVPEVAARGRVPVVVGGTGLYVTALLDGHDYAAQAWSPAVRERLAAELESGGLAVLSARLRELDPAAAARIDLRNPRRVLRALERAEAGGGGLVPTATPYAGTVVQVALAWSRADLGARIDHRARAFFVEDGLVAEVERLHAAGFGPELSPMSGHGYREAAALLAGRMDREAAIEMTARRTRQYAKRQRTWFRRDPRIRWLPAAGAPHSQLAAEVESAVHAAVG